MNTSPSNIGRDTVEIHAGTAQLISSFVDRVFVVDYRMPYKAPDLSPLIVAAPPFVLTPPVWLDHLPAPVRQLSMTKAAIAQREAMRRSRAKKKTERREHAPSESVA